MGTHILFLFVGEERHLLTLHSEILPPATKAYLTTRFAAEQVCWIREEDATTANLWRAYLYTGKVFSNDEISDQDERDYGRAESHADGEWTKLAHAYFLGQTLRDEDFANASIKALIEKVKVTERFPTGIAGEVYTYTEPGDKLRCLVVDLHVWMGEGRCLVEPHEDAEGPVEFLRDVIAEMAEANEGGERLWETEGCAYHEHRFTGRCGA